VFLHVTVIARIKRRRGAIEIRLVLLSSDVGRLTVEIMRLKNLVAQLSSSPRTPVTIGE
jgi:hypothetical protein